MWPVGRAHFSSSFFFEGGGGGGGGQENIVHLKRKKKSFVFFCKNENKRVHSRHYSTYPGDPPETFF